MSDIDELLTKFERVMDISNDLDYEQYYHMARNFMNKNDHDARIFAKRAIKEQEKDDLALFNQLKTAESAEKARARYKQKYELFLANKKKIAACRMNEDCSQEKRELNKLIDQLYNFKF